MTEVRRHNVTVDDHWYGRDYLFGADNIENSPKLQCSVTGSRWADTQELM